MAIPNVSGALRGWTKKRTIRKIEQTVSNFETVHTVTDERKLEINVQPTPEEEVDRRAEEQYSWTYWTLFIRDGSRRYSIDDVLLVDGAAYKIKSVADWRAGGFTKYISVEDYDASAGPDVVTYNLGTVTYSGSVVTYKEAS